MLLILYYFGTTNAQEIILSKFNYDELDKPNNNGMNVPELPKKTADFFVHRI